MNNILIDKTIEQEVKSLKNFENNMLIAKLNLEDYNKRLGTSHDLSYKKIDEKLRFTLDNSNNFHQDIAGDVNFFILWNSEKFDKTYFEILYRTIIGSEYNDLSMYNSPHYKKDNSYYKKVEYFKAKYQDYAPLGFLSDEESQSVKSEILKRFLINLT